MLLSFSHVLRYTDSIIQHNRDFALLNVDIRRQICYHFPDSSVLRTGGALAPEEEETGRPPGRGTSVEEDEDEGGKTVKRILFSCIGTSDPVRGEHDGPMLHILRHYRPEGVWLFLTPEMRQLAAGDGRLEKTRAWIGEHWGGYQPAFHYLSGDVRSAHDIDALDAPLHAAMVQISREHPEAEILINVTSGTPQMQMILSQLAMDTRYHAKGIQVSNFERKSGTSPRANQKEFDIDLELEFNEDQLPGAENRCTEPEMYAIRREFTRKQITALLDERNFAAVEELKDSLPEHLGKLASHLAARNRLHSTDALRLAGQVKDLPFQLYAYRTGSRSDYSPVSEYYLMMKNLAAVDHWTEFLLHMEPLTLTLQMAVLDRLMQKSGCKMADFLSVGLSGQKVFEPFELQNKLPALYAHYERCIAERYWSVKRADLNTYICDDLLSFFPEEPEAARQLFDHYRMLKDLRNRLAHTLYAATAQDVTNACKTEPAKLLTEIEATIMFCYSACDSVIFSVYDRCIDYIKSQF